MTLEILLIAAVVVLLLWVAWAHARISRINDLLDGEIRLRRRREREEMERKSREFWDKRKPQ